MESQDKVKRPGPTASWDRVSYLKIQSPSGQPNVKVFSNYFQACQVNVVVRFALGPDEVAITRAEAMAATSVVTAGTHQRPDFRAHGFAELYSSAPEYTWNEDIMNRFAALPAAINIACEAYTNQDILSRLNSNQMIAAPSDPDIEWDPHWLMRQVPNANNKIVRTLLQNLKSKPVEPSPIPQAPRAVDGQDEGIAVLEHTLTFYIAATDTAIGSLDVVARVHRPDYVYEYSDEFSPRSVVTIQAIPPYVPPPTTGFLYNTAKGEFIFSPRNSDRENFVWQESAIQLTISSTLIKFLPLSEGTFQLVWSDEFYAGAEQWEWEWEWGVFYIGAPECTAMKPVPTADPTWTRVNYLRIHSAHYLDSAKVFANDKQQCEIIVGIGLMNGNLNVDITEDFAKSLIKIINYTNKGKIDFTETPETSPSTWSVSHKAMGFRWDESIINKTPVEPKKEAPKKEAAPKKVKHAEPGAYIQEVKILVSAKEGASALKIAASVTHPTSGNSWNTANEQVKDDDGYGSGGLFNSSVTINARPPYKPLPSHPDFGNKEAGSTTRLARQPIAVALREEKGNSWLRIVHNADAPEWKEPYADRLYRFYESWISIAYANTRVKLHSVTLGADTKKWTASGKGDENSEWCAIFITTVHAQSRRYEVGEQGAYQLRHRIQGVYLKTLSECVNELVGGSTRYPGSDRVVIGILNGTDDNQFVDKNKTILTDDQMQQIDIVDEFGTTHKARITIDDHRYASIS
ncbi:hypothetical protein KCV01_g3144, partial [Aureobasidium melanogenum]